MPSKTSRVVKSRTRSEAKPNTRLSLDTSTVIWGDELESGDFIKVPRSFLLVHRYKDGLTDKLKARHQMLILVLASHRFQNKNLRVYWQELADDLGVPKDTVRKWAYELRDLNLLEIKQVRGRDNGDNRIGYRNEKNIFSLAPIVTVVKEAKKERDRQRQERAKLREEEE